MASLTIVIGVFSQKFGSGKNPILLVKMDADCLGGGELKGILRHPLLADNSWQQMTPRDEFSDLWMETCTGLSMNRVVVRRPTACDFLVYSTRKEPSLNLLMLLRVLAIAGIPSGSQRETVYYVGGHHLTTPQLETMASYYLCCRSVRY